MIKNPQNAILIIRDPMLLSLCVFLCCPFLVEAAALRHSELPVSVWSLSFSMEHGVSWIKGTRKPEGAQNKGLGPLGFRV